MDTPHSQEWQNGWDAALKQNWEAHQRRQFDRHEKEYLTGQRLTGLMSRWTLVAFASGVAALWLHPMWLALCGLAGGLAFGINQALRELHVPQDSPDDPLSYEEHLKQRQRIHDDYERLMNRLDAEDEARLLTSPVLNRPFSSHQHSPS